MIIRIIIFSLFIFSFIAHSGTVQPSVAWKNNNVVICWWDSEEVPQELKYSDDKLDKILKSQYFEPVYFNQHKKEALKNIITKNFQKEVTGIHFTGWKDCSDSKHYDVVLLGIYDFKERDVSLADDDLFIKESKQVDSFIMGTHGKANIGNSDMKVYRDQGLLQRSDPPKSNFGIFLFQEELSLKTEMTFLHEFAHIAGLMHEHTRAGAQKDPICQLIPLRLNQIKKDAKKPWPFKSTQYTSSYDPFSITNYCYGDVFGLFLKAYKEKLNKITLPSPEGDVVITFSQMQNVLGINKPHAFLSKGDIHALKCLYQYPNSSRLEKCHSMYNLNNDDDLNHYYQEYLK